MAKITKEEQIANIKAGLASNAIPEQIREMLEKTLAELEK
jgi:hypothetical protein